MKVIKQIIFLMLIIACNNVHPVHAGKKQFGYKQPDLHQQKQQARQIAKYLEKKSKVPTARFEQRHPVRHQITDVATRQKILALFFIAMITDAEVVHVASVVQNASKLAKSPYSKSSVKNPEKAEVDLPIVTEASSKLYADEEKFDLCQRFAICKNLTESSKYCCQVVDNYMTICCIYPNSTEPPSRCVYSDLFGVLTTGRQSDPIQINLTSELSKTKKMCASTPIGVSTRQISQEAKALLPLVYSQKSSRLQNVNGTHCTFKALEQDVQMYITHRMPKLIKMFGILRQIFNIPKTYHLSIEIFFENRNYPVGIFWDDMKISIAYWFLHRFSDKEQVGVYAHEFQHINQHEKYRIESELINFDRKSCSDTMSLTECTRLQISVMTQNHNDEAEADLFSIIACGHACIVSFFEVITDDDELKTLQIPTRENLEDMLIGHPHPSYPNRISVGLVQNKIIEMVIYDLVKNPYGETNFLGIYPEMCAWTAVQRLMRIRADESLTKMVNFFIPSEEHSGAKSKLNVGDLKEIKFLHYLIKKDNIPALQYFLEKGANPNMTTQEKDTPLHLAIYQRSPKAVQLLLKNGAAPNLKGKYDRTPLYLATEEGNVEIVNTLLACGADPNICKNGRTCLRLAALDGRVDIAYSLLIWGADPNKVDENGNSPLHMAASNTRSSILSATTEIAKLLLTRGANTDIKNNEGRTPLHEAAECGNFDIVNALLGWNADPKAVDNNGATPLDYAKKEGYEKIVKRLEEVIYIST